MKRMRFAMIAVAILLVIATPLAGCGGDAGRTSPSTQQGVSDVMQEQMQRGEEQDAPSGAFVGDADSAFAQVDYDLTTMGADMVYATVYDMMTNPSGYEGKIVRMEGPYYHTFYEATQKDYFYVIIQDATACCAQGLEFVWGDGSRAYPDEYPEDGAEVIVTGRFEVYTEESNGYAHLVDASLQAA